ncbi:hypothetical protein FRACA_3410003 [Frankia canadensis]|uniref:Uncharacterized protein n=1 Tax=Frankia canadensis TaxID=1836972 RepID=A0A2I2KV65_9ACTN|nr:hypothetical protein FRACA_3410003 [Frankia canadensis]SOU56836.1 hypothetical protein FRACA_3410003 [Frankia canadensis]
MVAVTVYEAQSAAVWRPNRTSRRRAVPLKPHHRDSMIINGGGVDPNTEDGADFP